MTEQAISRRNENLETLSNIGRMVLNSFYEAGKLLGGNFVVATYLRDYYSREHRGDSILDIADAAQGILGFVGSVFNTLFFMEGLSLNIEDIPGKYYLIAPSGLWLATNIASGADEFFRYGREKVRTERKKEERSLENVLQESNESNSLESLGNYLSGRGITPFRIIKGKRIPSKIIFGKR